MRVRDREGEFSELLLKLGSGTVPVKEEDPFKGYAHQDDYAKRVILTPTNVDSLSINEEVLEGLNGEVKTYLSADQIEIDDLNEINNFPVEFLNSLTLSGMPTHCLKLKIGCVIMLLRHLDLKAGLCNGTRMKVCVPQNNYIDAEVLTGVSEGKRVFVPRIQLAPSDFILPFFLKRPKFPVRLAYSMTINKIQGQTFDRVGVYFKKPCFSSCQLYVACSRTRAFNSLFFKVDKHPIQGKAGEKCYTDVIFSKVLNLYSLDFHFTKS
nr:ATP-dependent DNA helicase PIF1-like [Hydra vulgaris]